MNAAPAATQPEVRTISAAEFKAKCLQLMDEVNEKKLTLVITKRGKPVMQASAPALPQAKPFVSVVGRSPGLKIHGDIISPLPEEWTLPSWMQEKSKGKKDKGKGKKK